MKLIFAWLALMGITLLATSVIIGCSQDSCIDKKLKKMESIVDDFESLARKDGLDLIEINKRSEELKLEIGESENANPECKADTTTWTDDQSQRREVLKKRLETAGAQIAQKAMRNAFRK